MVEGQRQCVFVTGGPGSGKTALIEAFGDEARREPHGEVSVLVGHCFEQFGGGEPYMPVWEALGQLAREKPSTELSALLARHAEAYVPQAAVAATSHPQAQPVAIEPRAMSEHLLRAITDALESLAAQTPVILVLEDLHWADFSTLDLISALARRRSVARLMIVGTYRPAEVAMEEHPLSSIVRGLLAGRLGEEMELRFLNQAAVAKYLAVRFGENDFPLALAQRLHQRTDGHPLFLVHLVDDFLELGGLQQRDGVLQVTGNSFCAAVGFVETQIPGAAAGMIEVQYQRLPQRERAALEAAAVAGMEFSAAAGAGLLGFDEGGGGDAIAAEQRLQGFGRGYYLFVARGVARWAGGTAGGRF